MTQSEYRSSVRAWRALPPHPSLFFRKILVTNGLAVYPQPSPGTFGHPPTSVQEAIGELDIQVDALQEFPFRDFFVGSVGDVNTSRTE
jgi:hypothetical protein